MGIRGSSTIIFVQDRLVSALRLTLEQTGSWLDYLSNGKVDRKPEGILTWELSFRNCVTIGGFRWTGWRLKRLIENLKGS